ncbi:molybdate ABC transporter substrate-binding protein [Microbacterium sp. NPDC019599]|uniref:molybdate ABC transporter substrate-binding protein n=1 Tax=Microbacterium sp. NPDC019599 TaxID=3154690 RepID=UPI00340961B3
MKRVAAVLAFAAVVLLGGCASQSDEDPEASPAESTPVGEELTGELTIYAAASLKTAFDELATQFEARNPSLEVLPIVYDGSSTLATQLIEGAPADVFASADEANMQKVLDAGLASGSELFATNTLVIAVPAGNPGGVEDLSDLADDSVTVVLCAPEVPCGAASQTLLANAGLTVTPASSEQNVTAVLTKVAAGEADAGLVYVTDVQGRDDVESIVPEGAADVVNRYPVAALTDAANPHAAAAFAEFVLDAEGQDVLAGLGFGAP